MVAVEDRTPVILRWSSHQFWEATFQFSRHHVQGYLVRKTRQEHLPCL
jgi:hypothetical protein